MVLHLLHLGDFINEFKLFNFRIFSLLTFHCSRQQTNPVLIQERSVKTKTLGYIFVYIIFCLHLFFSCPLCGLWGYPKEIGNLFLFSFSIMIQPNLYIHLVDAECMCPLWIPNFNWKFYCWNVKHEFSKKLCRMLEITGKIKIAIAKLFFFFVKVDHRHHF